jgi:hypothetical protein
VAGLNDWSSAGGPPFELVVWSVSPLVVTAM